MKLHVTIPWECVNCGTRARVILEPGMYELERKVIQPPPPGSPPKKVWLVVAGTLNGMAEGAFRDYVRYDAPSVWIEEEEGELQAFLRASVNRIQPPRVYAANLPHFLGEHCIALFPEELPVLDHFKTAQEAHDWLIACFGEDQHRAWFPVLYDEKQKIHNVS